MGKAYPKDMKAKFKAGVMALVQKDHTFKDLRKRMRKYLYKPIKV